MFIKLCRVPSKKKDCDNEIEEPSTSNQEIQEPTEQDMLSDLQHQIEQRDKLLKEKDALIRQLKAQLKCKRFGTQRFGADDQLFNFYTWFSSY